MERDWAAELQDMIDCRAGGNPLDNCERMVLPLGPIKFKQTVVLHGAGEAQTKSV